MKEIPITFKVNNEQIVGILHLSKENSPIIIISHGLASNKLGPYSFFVNVARELAKNGFSVLRFDFRGCGDSEGNEQTITSMLEDLDAAINFIEGLNEVDAKRLCVIGHSLGAYISFLKAAFDKRIKYLVSWMGRVSSAKDFFSKVFFEELERKKYFIGRGLLITKKMLEEDLKYNLLELAKNIEAKALLIYGELDDMVPPSEGLKLKEVLKEKAELNILKDLDHFFNKGTNTEVIKITMDWLKKNLSK